MVDRFLRELFESGTIAVPPGVAEADEAKVRLLLVEAEACHRLDLPGNAPAWEFATSRWAAEIIFDACRALAHREIAAEEVTRLLSKPPPTSGTPSAHYSADVVFRALPDVIRLTRGISHDDPLTTGLLSLAKSWPLSSVGVADLGPLDIADFIDDPSLRRTYAQRIVQHKDVQRLDDERARREVQELLGAYPSFAPALALKMAQPERTPSDPANGD